MISATAIIFLTFNVIGGCCLLLLLCTYYRVETLPHRKNPFLINMILTSYLSSLPPLMLLVTGQQGRITIQWICTLQSALIDGLAPMFCSSIAILVFQTCADLRAILRGTTKSLTRATWLQWVLISAPYIMFLGWFIPSLTTALSPSARVLLYPFVFCTNDASTGFIARHYVGYFATACLMISILLEVWTAIVVFACLRFCRVSKDLANASTLYRANLHLFTRLLIFSIIQTGPIILMALNRPHTTPRSPRDATQIVECTYPLAVFLLFGMQRVVLQAWRILPPTAPRVENQVSEC